MFALEGPRELHIHPRGLELQQAQPEEIHSRLGQGLEPEGLLGIRSYLV